MGARKLILLMTITPAVLVIAAVLVITNDSSDFTDDPKNSSNRSPQTTLKVVEPKGEPQSVIDILQGTQDLQTQEQKQYQSGTPSEQLQPNAGRDAFSAFEGQL